MRESSKTAWSMEKELNTLLMETRTKATISKENHQGMESTTGRQVVSSRGTLREDWGVGKVSGRKLWAEVINMKENGWLTRSKAMEFSLGLKAMFIRGIIIMTLSRAVERCNMQTGLFSGENGTRTDRWSSQSLWVSSLNRTVSSLCQLVSEDR